MASVPQPWNDEVEMISGREFHKFSVRHGVYRLPVDETEEDRLDKVHSILTSWEDFGGLILPDPTEVKLSAVLDCGCGSGAWADAISDEYADGEDISVVGVDLYPPKQCEYLDFQRWNLNAPFRLDQGVLSERYTFINSRFLANGIDAARWPSYIQDMYGRLRSGGWLQMTEAYMNIQSDNGRRDEAPSLGRWWHLFSTALEQQGRDPRVGTTVVHANQRSWANLKALMTQAGFDCIQERHPRLPIGGWKPGASRYIGERVFDLMRGTLESLGLWACCRVHGMSAQSFTDLLDECVQEMSNADLHLYIQFYSVWGQKPGHGRRQSKSTRRSSQVLDQTMPPPSIGR
ncbi:hypothetical protein AAFC00_002601 [Neodothiora populina]|uniref:S-adenosyl-L-methionine-dependent methyltransferase n=1 Tax=Neodothiora populina TaxID=2781224 RepID=A0ABR3P8Y2_9PEZI